MRKWKYTGKTCYGLNFLKYEVHYTEDKLIFGDAELKILWLEYQHKLIKAGVSSIADSHFIDK